MIMSRHLLITAALLASYSCFVAAQTPCKTRNGVEEKCVVLSQCDPMLKLVRNFTRENRAIVRDAFCGVLARFIMVCCPTTKCITPEGKQGTCGAVTSCPHVVSMLEVPSRSTKEYVQKLICEGPDRYSVCCGPPPDTQKPKRKACKLTASLPPDNECCGRSSGAGVRIYGGTNSGIDEFPWVTAIEYRTKQNDTIVLCGGALISGQYVLTAGHCVAGAILNIGTPVSVRLGDYDISRSGPDCVDVPGGGTDCTEGELIVPIENIIPHPEYDPENVQKKNDIAIIQLDRIVNYTDFIRPICLPSTDFTEAPPKDLFLSVAGWGTYKIASGLSDIQQTVSLPYITNKVCQAAYGKILLGDGQMCAGGVKGKDACTGDSGGPLMRPTGKFMELVGIVSFGKHLCGINNVSGVYTKVYKYLPWIKSQVVSDLEPR